MTAQALPPVLADYPVGQRPGAWDEAVCRDGGVGRVREAYQPLLATLGGTTGPDLVARADGLARAHTERGVTFRHDGAQRTFHLDPFPRVLRAGEWSALAAGLTQRVRALEAFLGDVYSDQQIVADGVVPAHLVTSCPEFRPDLVGVKPPTGVRVHVAGIDVVRDGAGVLRVLEDNLRCPSGATYAVENRRAMQREFPDLFARHTVTPLGDYGALLGRVLRGAAGPDVTDPVVVLLTAGPDSPAWAEHCLLARWAGLPLARDSDLVVRGTSVFLRDSGGNAGRRVHVVYRRVDDGDLDPLEPGGDPARGVPGLMAAVRAGGVVLANAAGNGVADDKGVYTCVPDMVRYYLGESRCFRTSRRPAAGWRRSVPTPWTGWRSSCSSRCRATAGRGSSSVRRRRPTSWPPFGPTCLPIRAAGSPSPWWTCPRCRRWWGTPWCPVRWTFVRSY